MKTLVVGWFSFKQMGATAGDIRAKDLVCEWLTEAGESWDVALAPPFDGGVDFWSLDPEAYANVIFVCGPFPDIWVSRELLRRFAKSRIIGVNLTMAEPLDRWNPFDALFERDSPRATRPDVTFLTPVPRTPIVGVLLIDPQPDMGVERVANDRIEAFIASREMAVVRIDTRLDIPNRGGLRSPAEVEALIGRVDLVITTRLHGTVLALKQGVPAIAIDPVVGGGKISAQAAAIGWPVVFGGESVTEEELHAAFDYCLSEDSRDLARVCREGAVRQLAGLRDELLAALRSPEAPGLSRVITEQPAEEPPAGDGSGNARRPWRLRRVVRTARAGVRDILLRCARLAAP